MERHKKITLLNLTGFKDAEYASLACAHVNGPYQAYVVDGKEASPQEAWNTMQKTDVVIGSGSMENVGKETTDNTLEPALDNTIVRNTTTLYSFMVMQTLNGNADAARLYSIMNCFSAQTLAYALTLVATLKKGGVDLGRIRDISDLERLYPVEQTAEDSGFPIGKAAISQIGVYENTPHPGAEHWILDSLQNPQKPRLVFMHNQAILLEDFRETLEVLQAIQILTTRRIQIVRGSRTERKKIITTFAYNDKQVGTQSHTDYTDDPHNMSLIGFKARFKNDETYGKGTFYPGAGGSHNPDEHNPRTMKELIDHLSDPDIVAPSVALMVRAILSHGATN